jgi:hypothetical protein
MAEPEFMFDTNVFNRILEGHLSLADARGAGVLYATHIQRDELARTPQQEKRALLLAIFAETTHKSVPTTSFSLGNSRLDEACLAADQVVPTSSAVWDVSNWDEASWGEEDGLFDAMKEELDRANKRRANNIQDILIAETAIRINVTLVTDDVDLNAVAKKFGGTTMSVAEFLSAAKRRAT